LIRKFLNLLLTLLQRKTRLVGAGLIPVEGCRKSWRYILIYGGNLKKACVRNIYVVFLGDRQNLLLVIRGYAIHVPPVLHCGYRAFHEARGFLNAP
jgi:hypothetical protein